MGSFKVHLVHVGNMSNKGSQALLKSDVSIIEEVLGASVSISVSTNDIQGVKKLNLPLNGIFSPVVDIPYERADSLAKKLNYDRESIRYRLSALAGFVMMPVQLCLSVFSALFVKIGIRGFYRSRVLENIKKCDLVISNSDENFKEGASFLPTKLTWLLTWWSILVSKTWDVLMVKFFGKPIIMFPNSFGPFKTAVGRILAKTALNRYSLILLRDGISFSLAESMLGCPKIRTNDIVWLFESNACPHAKLGNASFVGVSPGIYSHVLSKAKTEDHISLFARTLDKSIALFGFHFVFLPQYVTGFQYDDLDISKMIIAEMKNKNNVEIAEIENADDLKSYVNMMKMVISSKLHPSVMALASSVPTVCIAYDQKQVGLFEAVGLADCVIPLHALSEERLLQKIGFTWGNQEQIRKALAAQSCSIRKNVKETISHALHTALTKK